MQKSGFHIAGTNIMSEGSQIGSNKVVLMSRNMFGTTTNAGFNTSEAIQDVKVFDDDDYLLNEDTTEHKYLHR